jgi:hypothetical protein
MQTEVICWFNRGLTYYANIGTSDVLSAFRGQLVGRVFSREGKCYRIVSVTCAEDFQIVASYVPVEEVTKP